MSSKTKKLLIASACVTAAGLIILIALGIYTKFDLKRLNSVAYKESTYDIRDSFSSINVETADCDVVFKLSDTVDVKITCVNPAKKDSFCVENGTLNIISTRKKSAASVFTPEFDFKDDEADIVVAVPNTTVDSLSIKTTGGNVEISNYFNVTPVNAELKTDGGSIIYASGASGSLTAVCTSGKIELENSKCTSMTLKAGSGEINVSDAAAEGDVNAAIKSGKLTVSSLECGNFYCTSDSGDVNLSGIRSGIYLNIKNGSGNVNIDKSDSNIVNITNDSGSVSAEFLTDKIFTTKSTDGGKIDIPDPRDDLAGKCVIRTKSGDVKCRIAG